MGLLPSCNGSSSHAERHSTDVVWPGDSCAVVTELQPPMVRAWIARPPAWIEVRQAAGSADAVLAALDAGERDAILLMQELHGDLL